MVQTKFQDIDYYKKLGYLTMQAIDDSFFNTVLVLFFVVLFCQVQVVVDM